MQAIYSELTMRYDLAALRVVAILAILLHHSFSAFGGWPPNVEYDVVSTPLFGNLSFFFKSLGLGLFTFVSGVLLNLQMEKPRPAGQFIIKKTKRLLVPCLIIGAIYLLLFPRQIDVAPWPDVINGTYLWYLPMLFVCQIATYFMRPGLNVKSLMAFLGFYMILKICRTVGIPYPDSVFVCLPLFLVGYFHRFFNNKWSSIAAAIIGGGIYIAYIQDITIISKGWERVFIQACFAVSLYWPAHKLVKGPLPGLWSLIDRKSFHMYLSHQFVINTLLLTFYFSGNCYLMAALVFAVTVPGSLGLALFLGKGLCSHKKFVSSRCTKS